MTGSYSLNNNEKDTDKERNCNKRTEVLIVFGMLITLAAVIGIVVWQTGKIDETTNISPTPTTATPSINWPISVGNLRISDSLVIQLLNNSVVKLSGHLMYGQNVSSLLLRDCSKISNTDVCIELVGDRKLTVNFTQYKIDRLNTSLDCYDLEWEALRCVDQVLTDCFDVMSASWYGGYADKIQNWPFEKNTRRLSAYIANNSYAGEIGGVVERYFFSSNGVGIFVDPDVPLYFSLNHPINGTMCLSSKYDKYPYFNSHSNAPVLKYKICQAANVKEIHAKMAATFISKPTGIPDIGMFKYPIWSTWAQYHKEINQSTVLEFANNILEYNFTHAQLEIDDDWTPAYGDMVFNSNKFPNATQMVKTLNNLGFRVTVWVHPFFNVGSKTFLEAANSLYLMRAFESEIPAMTPWWDGNLTGILDVSNPNATDWFLRKLENLKNIYNISSFKFDAGETSWLPHIYSAAVMPTNPAENYPRKWVALAAAADQTLHQEVRAGYRTQQYPVFVRMMDKMSNWGHDNALKTIIPCVLTYGILGYPFILPDMIGGNAYNDHPEPELYIRWLQLTTFLPSMQFSIVPWIYNDTIIDISQKFTKLHEEISDTLIKYANISTVTGAPIIRPLWWIAPDDTIALNCEDEFLVGDEYLVAPVVESGARSRDIYFPVGEWVDELRENSTIIRGPTWKYDYKVDLDELAYFTKIM